ncbi:ABC transporter ATP-binding protein [Chryseotalea sanaruensis]|uniref:ABC transporter ATP-binding protein n=1 Tax=Chryseotalea sanaruensis TaxID=2482724 RepID=A0A401U558_9BACT|nr:ABC transporter ATP-binding protein [Chryseotalea sanaruensis]GCC50058.1 ABC transporter ATP-binding protein [Chryseotalea sanaruensis]
MSGLKLSKISKKSGQQHILRSISFDQQHYKRMVIAGETGSGKSTLLKVIAGLAQADSGVVVFNNEVIKGPLETLVPGHAKIAYLSQLFELPKFLRVEQVLEYANLQSEKEANRLFKLCEIQHLLSRKTDELSGGERQRIALARQLLSNPELLLLDEPYSNLDIIHKNSLRKVIDKVLESTGIACILVSHDPLDILPWAEHVMIMRKGKIVQEGAVQHIYHEPADEYVAALMGKYNVVPKTFLKQLGKQKLKTNELLRPGSFKVSRRSSANAVEAYIESVSFCGSYFEVSVAVKKDSLTIYTSVQDLRSGERVFVSLN